ncbi:MAG: hypothetical protein ACI9KE_005217 [Polyangiales bacterium]|jgi:hypothetical protein
MKLYLSTFAVSLLLIASVSMGHAQTEAPTLRGRWALAASVQSVETRRDAAIERVTDEMSIFARGIAGRRLRAGMPVPRAILVEGNGADFRAKVGDYDLDFAADGSRHAMTDPFGDDIRSRQGFVDGRLRQTMVADGGTLTHVLRLNEGGQSLTLTVRIASPRLPADVVYRIRYRRR